MACTAGRMFLHRHHGKKGRRFGGKKCGACLHVATLPATDWVLIGSVAARNGTRTRGRSIVVQQSSILLTKQERLSMPRPGRSAYLILDPDRTESAGCARGTRWGARTRRYRRNRCRLRDRLERALPRRGCRIHLRRSQYPPNQNHPGIPDASTRTRRARLKFQIFFG